MKKNKDVISNIPSDLLIILIWVTITSIFVVTTTIKDSPIRTILSIPTILFIPGYVLIMTLFPKRNDLDNMERMAYSIGLSMVIITIIGLILNMTFGIKLISILITLGIYTIILILIAYYRREKLPEEEKFSISFHKIYNNIRYNITPKNDPEKILTGILIFTIIILIGMIFFMITSPKVGEKFTEFYVLNSSGNADNYDINLKVDNPVTYLIGVTNHEYEPVNYKLEVTLDQNILTSEEIMLNHEEIWKDNVTFLPDKEGTNMKLEFLLFRENDLKEPYRRLYLWVDSTR